MLRPRREMFAAPAASSRACTLWNTLSNSAARAFEARKSADGISGYRAHYHQQSSVRGTRSDRLPLEEMV